MSRALLSIACHLYGTAAIVALVFLVRPTRLTGQVARWSTVAGLALHGVALAMAFTAQQFSPLGVGQGLLTVSWLLLAFFVAVDFKRDIPVLAAFVLPIALAMLIPGLLLSGSAVPRAVQEPLLPVHIAVALGGLAAFAFAAGVGVVYVLMERQVKAKKFGLLFSRLPPLQTLDDLNRRLVVGGFIALSFAFVTGAFFASARGGLRWDPKELATIAAWLVFAGVLIARLFAGWRGKKVALLTLTGFGFVLVSFLSAYSAAATVVGVR